MARGINADAVAQEFLQHATEEPGHADLIAGRIAIERQGGMIRRMMEDIPAMKEAHADDLRACWKTFDRWLGIADHICPLASRHPNAFSRPA